MEFKNFDNNKIKLLQTILFDWGKSHFRNFSWRFTKDPYKIMIAEFMLHRTRVKQVVHIYNEFIIKYPDIFSLARENETQIKKVTEHLGLHWRGDHFVKAAKYIVEKYDGIFPKDKKELLSIPGVGEYVTGVIYTVCYNYPYPVIDSNIARFISRVFGIQSTGEIRRKKVIVDIATHLFEVNEPSILLFSILDFTAEVCTAKNPNHMDCPLNEICEYHLKIINNLNNSRMKILTR